MLWKSRRCCCRSSPNKNSKPPSKYLLAKESFWIVSKIQKPSGLTHGPTRAQKTVMTTYMSPSSLRSAMAARSRKLRGRRGNLWKIKNRITLIYPEAKISSKAFSRKSQMTKNLAHPSLVLTTEITIGWEYPWIWVIQSRNILMAVKSIQRSFKFLFRKY